jgi:EmrB/QacA subfamily drug resistance transporter
MAGVTVIHATDGFCPRQQRRYVLIAAILASAMGFIDGTVVAIAMPAMRQSLGASLAEAQWISNAYLLTLSALILVAGAAGDRFGLRRAFAAGIAIFVVASIFCALSPNPLFLIAARAVQGAGAAIMVPGSLAIISKAYPKDERGRAIGIWAAASAVTTTAGPILGGFLLSAGNPEMWRIIFAINLPLGAVALYLLLTKVPPDPHVPARRIDVAGGFLAIVMLACLAWALTGVEGEGRPPSAGHFIAFGLASAIALATFLAIERSAPEPVMPLRIWREPSFTAANVATFCLYAAMSAVLFFLPMTLIAGWRLAEAQVSLAFVPLGAAIALLSGPVGQLADRVGAGILIAIGSAVVGISYVFLGWNMAQQEFWRHVMPAMCLAGIGMALVVTPLSVIVMGAVDEATAGIASGINNAVSRVAGLLAVAGMGTVAGAVYATSDGPVSFGAALEGLAGRDAAMNAAHAAATNAAFAVVAYASALLCFVASAVAVLGIKAASAKA